MEREVPEILQRQAGRDGLRLETQTSDYAHGRPAEAYKGPTKKHRHGPLDKQGMRGTETQKQEGTNTYMQKKTHIEEIKKRRMQTDRCRQ